MLLVHVLHVTPLKTVSMVVKYLRKVKKGSLDLICFHFIGPNMYLLMLVVGWCWLFINEMGYYRYYGAVLACCWVTSELVFSCVLLVGKYRLVHPVCERADRHLHSGLESL